MAAVIAIFSSPCLEVRKGEKNVKERGMGDRNKAFGM